MDLAHTQSFMRDQRIDGWLLYDFRGSNHVLPRVLPGKRWTTRRVFLFIPAAGEPVALIHGIDFAQFDAAEREGAIRREKYLTWREMAEKLRALLAGRTRVAMEYAPGCALPVVSIADAGTVELVRSLGVEVVSSANLIQVTAARWTAEARRGHAIASEKVARVKDEAFALIRDRVRSGTRVLEHEVQRFILDRFVQEGLETADEPVVAVNAHSGDPHYGPSAANPTEIRRGDWILIDLWARLPGEENIFSDITWVGFAGGGGGENPSDRHRHVFETVRRARDAAVRRVREAWSRRELVQGWQVDDAAMHELRAAGLGEFIRHRTGHSLSAGPAVHGIGVNMDNLETHDTREVLPGIGFTIEPGLYTPDFGVRLEINLYMDPERGPEITSPVQEEIVMAG